jgi:YggT family protein
MSWFGGGYGRAETILRNITDPFLNWFRRFTFLRMGNIDLSPMAAIAVLSLLNRAFFMLATYGTLRLGILLAVALQLVWSIISFLLVFCIIILALRLIAYLTNQNTFGRFWGTINAISQPIIYRMNRIIFGGRIVNYFAGILVFIGVLLLCILLGGFLMLRLSDLLARLPV